MGFVGRVEIQAIAVGVDLGRFNRDAIAIGASQGDDCPFRAGHAEVGERHVIGASELEDVTTASRVAAIEDRAQRAVVGKELGAHGQRAGVKAFDAHSGIVRRDKNVLRECVIAGVDADRVARAKVVGFEQRADRGLGRVRREAVVGIVAGGGCPIAADYGRVVDVVQMHGRGN